MATGIRGTAGDDNLTGSSGNDNFLLWQGGNDTVAAGDGNDIFRMAGTLNAGDSLDGGTGKDAVILNGDYSAGVVFGADTITNVEVLALAGRHSYDLTTNDGNIASGARMLVKAGALGSGDHLTFDGSAETDGGFYVLAGAGDDTVTGGAKHDIFNLSQGGTDTVHGGGGNDTFLLGDSLWSDDQIDGGAGQNTLHVGGFSGGDTIVFTDTTVQHIQDFVIDGGSGLSITTVDATVAAGQTMTFDASTSNDFTLDVSAETDSHFVVIGSAGDDTVHFGKLTIDDKIDGGTGGDDTLYINGDVGSDSLALNPDTMVNVDHLIVAADAEIELALNDATIAAGATMTFDGRADATHGFYIDGEFETDGHLDITGGGGFGVLGGGALSDTLTTTAHTSWYELVGMGGADTLNLSSGEDDVGYVEVSDSTGAAHDVVSGFDAGEDFFAFFGSTVGGFDGVLTGKVDATSLDSDLHAITSGALVANDAWEVDVTSGDLSGHQFLIVDVDGNAQYDGGSDYLIDITGHTGTITAGNFI